MKLHSLADLLWGEKARFSYLMIASFFLLFTLLGVRELWTQEHRWADIVFGMLYRHDFLHPYLGENQYYDKPLLSYWLIIFFAKLIGGLSTWSLRLPSALSGLLAIWSIYSLGVTLKNKQLGLLSGWILLTTFYFVFWARTSSADMLNLSGSLFAVSWYMAKRHHMTSMDYTIFFFILALTSLCKGLTGAIVPFFAVCVDILLEKSWKQHLQFKFVLCGIPALIIYLLPFLASSYFDNTAYSQNGLYLVYRENFLRYFEPFDHRGPIYTYFIYLPIYILPWALFFIPALFSLMQRWKTMTLNSKWIIYTMLVLFLFFTFSGSRRSYYVLSIVPFAILFTADWILNGGAKRRVYSAATMVISFVLLFLMVDLLPGWYYSQYGVNRFAETLKKEAEKINPWSTWHIVMLDAESKLNFYLQLPPDVKNHHVRGGRERQTITTLLQAWPILTNKPAQTIFISRKCYKPLIQPYFTHYRIVEMPSHNLPFLKNHNTNSPIAFIPIPGIPTKNEGIS